MNSQTTIENDEHTEALNPVTRIAHTIKVGLQCLIGATLMATLLLKGAAELMQTLQIPHVWDQKALEQSTFMAHLLSIHTFQYIGKALGISAGIDLGYMLFTEGPDEALTPLMLGISSAAFLTISEHPDNNWTVGVYVLCILVLMFCMKKYDDWGLGKSDAPKKLKRAAPATKAKK
ncbi:hypothetical protein F3J20_16180 [Paraburkholderia sp. Cy-641]|uniref:hypothetical protein n=1 Tax=Paraburkholderia sp. Cy-641 TaxID=2608337 RepID=UPI00141D95F9|nr:hypothetical protein [Paraburkholderia sp. Cy-641]NIF78906.1 hypothetical protein [Paraburkholderia sp. Cy-641]